MSKEESSEQITDQTSSINSQDLALSSVNIKSFNNGQFDTIVTPRRGKEELQLPDELCGCEDKILSINDSGRQLSEISENSPL